MENTRAHRKIHNHSGPLIHKILWTGPPDRNLMPPFQLTDVNDPFLSSLKPVTQNLFTVLHISMNKTPNKCTCIYLHMMHLHVSVLSDHSQGALVTEYLDIKMCLSKVQSLFIYVEWGPSVFMLKMLKMSDMPCISVCVLVSVWVCILFFYLALLTQDTLYTPPGYNTYFAKLLQVNACSSKFRKHAETTWLKCNKRWLISYCPFQSLSYQW
jgi:hypothetical protein